MQVDLLDEERLLNTDEESSIIKDHLIDSEDVMIGSLGVGLKQQISWKLKFCGAKL